MNKDVMFSSKCDEWSTPSKIFEELDAEFNFTLDPCATDENHKCDFYFTKNIDGLKENWGGTECLLIHLTHRLSIGLKKHGKKVQSQILLWLCLFRQELIQNIFMNILIIEVK